MKRRYVAIIPVVLAAVFFIGVVLRPYTVPEPFRSRKAAVATAVAGGVLGLIALWARQKMKTAQTKKERKNAQRILRWCAVLSVGSFGASAYGVFSGDDKPAGSVDRAIKRADGSRVTADELTVADINAENFNVNQDAPAFDRGTLLTQYLHYGEKEDEACALIEKGASVTKDFCGEKNAFHDAALHGQSKAIRALIGKHKDLMNVVDLSGNTPLMYAIYAGEIGDSFACVKALLEAGADMTVGMRDGDTLLHYAARRNSAVTRYLIEVMHMNKWVTNNEGQTPLHCFASGYAKEGSEVIELLCRGATLAQIDAQDAKGRTALYYAAAGRKLELFKALLVDGAEANIVDKDGKSLLTALLTAPFYMPDDWRPEAIRKQSAIALELLKRGASFDQKYGEEGESLFYCALRLCWTGDTSAEAVVAEMLEKGVCKKDLLDAFSRAIKTLSGDELALLLKHRCLERFDSVEQRDLLLQALSPGGNDGLRARVAIPLIQSGVPADESGRDGDTPLLLAVKGLLRLRTHPYRVDDIQGFKEFIAALLNRGVSGESITKALGLLRDGANEAEQEVRKMLIRAQLLFPEAEDLEGNTLMGVFLNIANSDKESVFDARRIIDYAPISLSALKSACNLATDDDWRNNGNRLLNWLMGDKYCSPVRPNLLSTSQELSKEEASKELLDIAQRIVAAGKFIVSESNKKRFDALCSGKEKIKFW